MNTPEIIPGELSGFCDITTGECVVLETDTSPGAKTDNPPPRERSARSRTETPLSPEGARV